MRSAGGAARAESERVLSIVQQFDRRVGCRVYCHVTA
jgi:hypothetical protein